MKKILVTGGCGFIGSRFIRRSLEKLTDTRIVNLDKLTYAGQSANLKGVAEGACYRFVEGDICDSGLLDKLFVEERFDTVVHFAAESHVDRSITDPAEFVRTNVFGTFCLLEAARQAWRTNGSAGSGGDKRRFVHVSTEEVYGSLGENGCFTESSPYAPRSPYAASKASADHFVMAYFHTYALPVVITNCSNNYGPHQFPEKLIPLMIGHALYSRPLPVYGDGSNVRDWIYVDDHCDALLRVIAKGREGQTYNIGGGEQKSNLEVVRTLCDLIDSRVGPPEGFSCRRDLIRFVEDRPGHDWRYATDFGKISGELGWAPRTPFEVGIALTVDWYLENRAWLDMGI